MTFQKFHNDHKNPDDDLDRECPYCFTQFKANHRSERFCGIKCRDDYHNRSKRIRAHEERIRQDEEFAEKVKMHQQNQFRDALLKNIRILSNLYIGKYGREISLNELNGYDFDLGVYDSRENTNNNLCAFFIKIGPFKIERINVTQFKLYRI